jgi:Patatin-like phospholipase
MSKRKGLSNQDGTEVRIALTISGAISLGAYEAGVLAALLVAVRAVSAGQRTPPLRVDAIGGASAGALTAIAAARVLTGGVPPVALMRKAWVENARLDAMFSGAKPYAPLDIHGNLPAARNLMTMPGNWDARQQFDVSVSLALCNLRGLHFKFKRLATDGRIATTSNPVDEADAITYLDWRSYQFQHAVNDASQFLEPANASALDFALASGSNEFAFAPYWQCRPGDAYKNDEVDNFPTSGGFWYTDGGTIDNEPLGRTMDLAQRIDGRMPKRGHPFHRLHLLIHPNPSSPIASADLDWAKPDDQPRWSATRLRGLEQQRTQSLYNDMYAAEKANSRVTWTQQLVDAIEDLVPTGERARWAGSLKKRLDELKGAQAALPRWTHGVDNGQDLPPLPEEPDPTTLEDVLWQLIGRATGVGQKNLVGIEQISPNLVNPDGKPLQDLLAGEILGSFGGFLDIRLRQSDFRLGYRSMQAWFDQKGLERYGLSSALSDQARAKVDEEGAKILTETVALCGPTANMGTFTLGQELGVSWFNILRLAARYPAVLRADARAALFHQRRKPKYPAGCAGGEGEPAV